MILDVSLLLKMANLTKFFCVKCKRCCVSVAHPSSSSNLHLCLTPSSTHFNSVPVILESVLLSPSTPVWTLFSISSAQNPMMPYNVNPIPPFWFLFLRTTLMLGSQQIITKRSRGQTAVQATAHIQLLFHVFLIVEASWLTGCPSCSA